MKPRFYLNKNGTVTGPHEAVETFLAWQGSKLASDTPAQLENAAEWIPLSAQLDAQGFDVQNTRRLRRDKVITMAEHRAAQERASKEQALAALAQRTPRPAVPAPAAPARNGSAFFSSLTGAIGGVFIGGILFTSLLLYSCQKGLSSASAALDTKAAEARAKFKALQQKSAQPAQPTEPEQAIEGLRPGASEEECIEVMGEPTRRDGKYVDFENGTVLITATFMNGKLRHLSATGDNGWYTYAVAMGVHRFDKSAITELNPVMDSFTLSDNGQTVWNVKATTSERTRYSVVNLTP